jgi:hypothetical protein
VPGHAVDAGAEGALQDNLQILDDSFPEGLCVFGPPWHHDMILVPDHHAGGGGSEDRERDGDGLAIVSCKNGHNPLTAHEIVQPCSQTGTDPEPQVGFRSHLVEVLADVVAFPTR